MTDEEYTAKQEELLEGVHPVLRSALTGLAYDRGHSAGMEETLYILEGLVSDFASVNLAIMAGERSGYLRGWHDASLGHPCEPPQ